MKKSITLVSIGFLLGMIVTTLAMMNITTERDQLKKEAAAKKLKINKLGADIDNYVIQIAKLSDENRQLKQIEFNKLIEPSVLKAVITVESLGNPKAHNEKEGAVGLMQLRHIVYNGICGMTKEEAFDPQRNVACGTLYLKHLINKYSGNLEKALHWYNNGYKGNPEYVERVRTKLGCEKGKKACRSLLKNK